MYGEDAESGFPGIPEGIAVRTLLKYEDLLLLRKVFVWYGRYNQDARCDLYSNDVARLHVLLNRMLRKGGSEFYAKRKEAKR